MPETVPGNKMSAEEMADYYVRVHKEAIRRDGSDFLGAVIHTDANVLINRFTDFAHRLGMKRAFRILDRKWGSLAARSVLDVGCGRGRWSKEFAARGARVTGADISPEATDLLAAEMPRHKFISADVAALDFPDESFDIVNSVTVLQHMPEWKQQLALDLFCRWVKPEGCVVLLENVIAFDAPNVFPHAVDDWIRMAEATGLRCCCRRGSNFEVLFRIQRYSMNLIRREHTVRQAALPSISPVKAVSVKHRIKSGFKTFLAAASFPVEWGCEKLPVISPTHSLMIFSKR